MKSQALQEFVNKIFCNQKIKGQFLANPEYVLSQFTLTDEEKRAVLSLHAKMGLATNNSQQLEAALDPTWVWT
jgi:hypothetical protein